MTVTCSKLAVNITKGCQNSLVKYLFNVNDKYTRTITVDIVRLSLLLALANFIPISPFFTP